VTERSEPSRLGAIAGRAGHEIALIDDHTSFTWDELDQATHAIALAIEAAGLEPRAHVALIAGNRIEFITSLLGAQRGGFTITPVKTNWTPDEIAYLLADAGSALVITDTDAGRSVAATAGLPLVDLDDAEAVEAWLAPHRGQSVEPGRTGYRVPYTSGTWAAASAFGAAAVGLPTEGEHLMVSPLFHGAPLAFGLGAMLGGATLRIMGRWEPAQALRLLSDATASIMVPTMFRQLLALPAEQRAAFDPSRLVTIFHGGESCPPDVKR
jgi:long-chain acyl-CoA synthetase